MQELISQDAMGTLARALIDSTPVAYVILDRSFGIRYLNRNFARLRNLDTTQVLGEKCYNISNSGMPCRRCAVAQCLETGERAMIPRKDIFFDGTVRFIDDYAVPLQRDGDGRIQYVLEIMVDRTQEKLARQRRNRDYTEILSALSQLIESKDSYTAQHSHSVRRLAVRLAREMELPDEDVFEISVAASLHDIGKVTIPERIINKPGPLTPEEFELIKAHSQASYDMLDGFSSFERVRDIALHHHERMDGTGYPDGLSGRQISLGSRIIAVADTYDAMTSTRSYRKALSHEYAIREIRRVAGSQLDCAVVDAFFRISFDDLDGADTGKPPQATHTVERILHKARLETSARAPDLMGDDIDLKRLLQEILRHTPCGYLVLNAQGLILYASDFFLHYMNCTDAQVLGGHCSDVAPGLDGLFRQALAEGSLPCVRQTLQIHGVEKISDVYSVRMENQDNGDFYVIEILLDRTEEELLERTRSHDVRRLVDMLSDICARENSDLGTEKLSGDLAALKSRVAALV